MPSAQSFGSPVLADATEMRSLSVQTREQIYHAARWEWRERADAWDDACHRVEDQERLEAIRQMHSTHRRAGRAAVAKAIQGLAKINAEEMSPVHVARLLELGAKLERSTLLTSVEELQGLDEYEDEESEDPWDRIARELDPANAIPDL